MFFKQRPRRLRQNQIIRDMIAETRLDADIFMLPYFVLKGSRIRRPIDSMPGVFQFSSDKLLKDVEKGLKSGLNKIILFGIEEGKDAEASMAYDDKGVVPTAIRKLRSAFGKDLYIATDVCLCAYTDHGHCGVKKGAEVLNDPSLDLLAQMAVTHAEAGADMVAPSDMMDGRVGAIREALENQGLQHTALMSYSVKYASNYYGPFRDAADSSPQSGDRKTYQMDFRNSREGIREAKLDEAEGADMLMVKPALAYLDVIKTIADNSDLPLACYNVSGEYSMVKLAAKAGIIKERDMVMENMYAFARAGADLIISYHSKDILQKNWL